MAAKARKNARKALRKVSKKRRAKRRITRRARNTQTPQQVAVKAPRVAKKPRASKTMAWKPKTPKMSWKPKAPKMAYRKAKTPRRKAVRKPLRIVLTGRKARSRKPKRLTKKSQTGTRRKVWNGSSKFTSGGLTRSDLMLNQSGKLVSKKQYAHGYRQSAHIRQWGACVKQARMELGITGFVAINKGVLGIALYHRAKRLHTMWD